MCLPYLSRIGNGASADGLYAPSEFHVEGFSAGSYTGVLVLALRVLFPERHVSATLGAIFRDFRKFGNVQLVESPIFFRKQENAPNRNLACSVCALREVWVGAMSDTAPSTRPLCPPCLRESSSQDCV